MNGQPHGVAHGLASRSVFSSVNATVDAKRRQGTSIHRKRNTQEEEKEEKQRVVTFTPHRHLRNAQERVGVVFKK